MFRLFRAQPERKNQHERKGFRRLCTQCKQPKPCEQFISTHLISTHQANAAQGALGVAFKAAALLQGFFNKGQMIIHRLLGGFRITA